ncbi:DUF1189 family protein [Alteribacillus sp. HJP-4]|uniref:DUF1189 family protein n=1 Tax=Alteribacillus sp. HJP-4 TaxID=2775394 RepID=UPI0035CD1684
MNIFKKFFKSLYSFRTIGSFRFQGIGKTILYVFFLMFIASIPSSIIFTSTFLDPDSRQQFINMQLENVNLPESDASSIMETIEGMLPILIPVGVIGLYLISVALKFIGIFFLSLFGLMIRKTAPQLLSYRQIWMISAYTVTLPTIIIALIDLLPFVIPLSFTIYWIIAFFMLYQVFKHLPKPKERIT